jgi:hypothetical protein
VYLFCRVSMSPDMARSMVSHGQRRFVDDFVDLIGCVLYGVCFAKVHES